jgi:putative ABC transport system permease protein
MWRTCNWRAAWPVDMNWPFARRWARTRSRLVGQLLTESGLLGLVGGALGVLLASWAILALKARLATEFALPAENLETVTLNLRVLGFTAGLSIMAGMLTGLVPALSAGQPDVMNTLKEGGRQATGDRRRQVPAPGAGDLGDRLGLVLLTGAGLFLHAFLRGVRFDPGMELDGVVAFQIMPNGPRYAGGEQVLGSKRIKCCGSWPPSRVSRPWLSRTICRSAPVADK